MIVNGDWEYLPVGFEGPGGCWSRELTSSIGHYCAEEGDVIGFRYGGFGNFPGGRLNHYKNAF